MSSEKKLEAPTLWKVGVERFEWLVVATLGLLLAIIIAVVLAVVTYFFVARLGEVVSNIDNINELQQAALRGFSGVLLVLLGLELLDTVKVYFQERTVRVEVILLVGLIAMGRHVLEIDLHHISPLTLFGFSGLILVLAISYFLVKRANISATRFKQQRFEEKGASS